MVVTWRSLGGQRKRPSEEGLEKSWAQGLDLNQRPLGYEDIPAPRQASPFSPTSARPALLLAICVQDSRLSFDSAGGFGSNSAPSQKTYSVASAPFFKPRESTNA